MALVRRMTSVSTEASLVGPQCEQRSRKAKVGGEAPPVEAISRALSPIYEWNEEELVSSKRANNIPEEPSEQPPVIFRLTLGPEPTNIPSELPTIVNVYRIVLLFFFD
jgi:hypothetical protein